MIRLFALKSVFLCLALLLSFTAQAESKAEITEKQLKKINKDILSLQKSLGEDKSHHEKETKALRKVELELEALYKRSRELKSEKKEIKNKITELRKEETLLQNKNDIQEQALKNDLRIIYQIGKQEKLKLLLNQENPENISRILKYYDYYSEARVERILAFRRNIDAIEKKRETIEQELAQLELIEEALKKEAKELTTHQEKRQVVLESLKQKIQNQDEELQDLKANQTRLSKLLRSLKGIWADIPSKLSKSSLSKRKGKLKKPVEGKLIHGFGSQRAGGRLKWNGWLIDANLETPVEAIHDGRVVFSDWIRGYGLLIIVDHSDGYLSLYGHNASLLKEAGDWIREGEVLATVGNSGGQYKPGLYFELRKDAEPLNPKYWLSRR